jgi:hypothetical protein
LQQQTADSHKQRRLHGPRCPTPSTCTGSYSRRGVPPYIIIVCPPLHLQPVPTSRGRPLLHSTSHRRHTINPV